MLRSCALITGALLCAASLAVASEPRGMVYEFGATWCGPCQQMAPVIEKLEREGLPVRKIDIDQQRDLANQYRIERIPTFVVLVEGQEVDRHVGPLTEGDLRRMVAHIPASEPAIAAPAPTVPPGPMNIPVQLGNPEPLTRPTPFPSQPEETRIVENEPKSRLRDYLPFARRNQEPQAPEVIRANDEPLKQPETPFRTAQAATPRTGSPMEASVRIRVINNGRIDLGSGTVISSAPGNTQILTCAHIFKEFSPESRIEVDLFEDGRSNQYIARLVKFNAEADVGLIAVPTSGSVPTNSIATRESAPRAGDPVIAIGCSGGEDPTQQQLQVTDIDKYQGPNNILCTGVPVSGRSGGGLFNQRGEIIGVCSAADKINKRGFYSGLFAIHDLLDECGLASLYTPATPPQTEMNTRVAAAESSPVAGSQFASEPQGGSGAALNVASGDAEVLVVIRDRSQPQAQNRVIIIHQPSPKFYSYLSGELNGASIDTPLSATYPEPAKQLLLPTTLSQSPAPQKYVRSAESRQTADR